MEELYNELKKEHNLPNFEIMDQEFEIFSIEDEEFLLRNVRKKIVEKIDSATKLFDEIFHPDSGFASFRESNVFNESDRENMVEVYNRLKFFYRFSTELSFDDSDRRNAEFINDFMKEWPDIKVKIIKYVKMMKESWKKEVNKKEVVRYLG